MDISKWISFHFVPDGIPDDFLSKSFQPFLSEHVWNNKGKRAFFIRYGDESGPHLRLRFKGEPEWLEKTIRPQFNRAFKKKGSWTEVPYVQEPEKFGGTGALAWCEEHFHISTRVILDRLRRPNYEYSDAMLDALKLHTAAAVAAGVGREKTASYFASIAKNWIVNFFIPKDASVSHEQLITTVTTDFEKLMKDQFGYMQDAVAQFRLTLEENKIDASQPEWLRWLHGNELVFKGLEDHLDLSLPHLLHLTNNRLGINNQDEAYLMYILGQLGRL